MISHVTMNIQNHKYFNDNNDTNIEQQQRDNDDSNNYNDSIRNRTIN